MFMLNPIYFSVIKDLRFNEQLLLAVLKMFERVNQREREKREKIT